MRKTIMCAIIAVMIAGTVFAQNAVGTRAGYRSHNQLGAYFELGIVNPLALYLMPSVRAPRDGYDMVSITLGTRLYPFDFGDLGFPGYPRNRRDFRHQLSPFVSVGAEYAAITAPEVSQVRDYRIDEDMEQVILAPLEVGVRWYLFRTLVFTRSLALDNAFIEVPIGYTLNVSSLTGVLNYNEDLDDEFKPFYVGIAAGFTF